MNTLKKLPIIFKPDDGFAVRPVPRALARGKVEKRLEALKDRLLAGAIQSAEDLLPAERIEHLATEAAALAWTTPYPLLVLPELFKEQLSQARLEEARQEEIRIRSEGLMAWAV